MDIYEELVMRYLCDGKPYIFLCPNFRLAGGEAFPDFVLLDFKKKIVSVVEVTTNANPVDLIKKVQDRNVRWFDKLKKQLQENSVTDDTWKYRVQVFVREEPARKFHEKFAGQSEVEIRVLGERVLHCWKWDWSERQ
jgi:hypothetical protein